MSTGSSGCVLRNLFTCEKKCNSVASRKALLEDFTSKIYDAEVVYVDNDGKTTEETYAIIFQLSENQKDSEMIRVYGNASMQFNEDTPIKASWSAIYLEKKHGYKMKLSGDNIEKEFYLYCDGNETIPFSIKKTASGDSSNTQLISDSRPTLGSGILSNTEKTLIDLINKFQELDNMKKDQYEFSQLSLSKQNSIINKSNTLYGDIKNLALPLLTINNKNKNKIPTYLISTASLLCACNETLNFCKDSGIDTNVCNSECNPCNNDGGDY